MFRYLCQFCYTIVTYGEGHPCFFNQDGDYVYSLPETHEKGNRELDEATKIRPENLRDNFENPRGVAKKENADESEKLNRSLVERDGHFVNSSNTLISGPLPNVPSFSPHSRDNQTTYIWNPFEGFKPVYRCQGDIRGASQRISRQKNIVYEKDKGIGCDSISFCKESSATCRTSPDERGSKVSINAQSWSSSNTKTKGKEAHPNSTYICETPNLIPCFAFPQGIERSNKVITEHLHNPIFVPLSPELTLLHRYSSGLSITNAEKLHNLMENANLIAGSRSTNGDPTKKRFPCNECDKSFDYQSVLARHYRTHSGEKPFICVVCQKGFARKEHLNTHYRIHTGQKPFVCFICNRAFTTKSHLKRHGVTHTGKKPFVCNVCQKKFTLQGNLKTHYRSHAI